MRAEHDFVLFFFLSCDIYTSMTKTCTPFWYQRDCKETMIIVYHIFLVYCELNMEEWVSIYEICECDIGHPISTGFRGLKCCQRDPRDRGVTICWCIQEGCGYGVAHA